MVEHVQVDGGEERAGFNVEDGDGSDADGDEKVGLREFMGWWEHRQYETRENQDRELEDLFKAVDNDGSGRIDWEEFLNLVS